MESIGLTKLGFKFYSRKNSNKKRKGLKHQFLTKLFLLFIVIQKGITIENSIIFTKHLYCNFQYSY